MSPAIMLNVGVEAYREEEDEQVEITKYYKGVKHLCENGITKIPRKYVLPVTERPYSNSGQLVVDGHNNNNNNCTINLPIVDFSQLQGPNRSQVLHSLATACEDYGFFQLTNHGIGSDIILKMIDVSRRFFELTFDERAKYMSTEMQSTVRYGTSFNQIKDGVFCWRDFLKLSCHPLPDVLPFWPSSPPDFRQAAENYSKQIKFLYLMVMEAILESLGLKDEETIGDEDEKENEISLKKIEDGSHLMMLNCYPSCPEPELTLGMPPHSDYGLLTLLLQDEVKGLQIQHGGRWVTVEPIPNSFVVNVGDHLEIFSNGRYKSVLHRVLVNPSKSRISVASLHSLPFNAIIRPSPKLIDESNPRRYADTDFASFLEYHSSFQHQNKNFLESRKLT